ncbi:MAG TPA: FtsW/RodA/SpoVE family cell cycle protein, partial [Phycisphaerae bacterium]|nr:FtsW/RodA/SpoVE family cell cycle protein [Phycisphaerae bacterium]
MKQRLHELTRPAWVIVVAVAVLYGIGLASIYASEAARSRPYFTYKQLVFLLGSLVLTVVVLRVGFRWISRQAYAIFALALVALIPLAIARFSHFEFGGLVPVVRGAYRWIRLPGFQLQPSEFMKVAFILALAWYLRDKKNYRNLRGLMVPFAASMVPLVLILLEPDLGSVLLIMPVLFAMLFVAGARLRHLALVAAIGLALTPLFWMKMRPYQRLRITAVLLQSDALRTDIARNPNRYWFLNEDADALRREARQWQVSSGMQTVRSKAALGSGGALGQGWGHGTYVEYDFLPDRHNDFVFALIGHQWGLLGCLLVLACYVVIILAGAVIATASNDPVGRLLAAGVVALVATQVLINVGMGVGLMPVTGMTLPFVSYGGSSLLTNFIAIALLISVDQYRPYLLTRKPFDFDETPLSFPPPREDREPGPLDRRADRGDHAGRRPGRWSIVRHR